jgi:hypothetical protein
MHIYNIYIHIHVKSIELKYEYNDPIISWIQISMMMFTQ